MSVFHAALLTNLANPNYAVVLLLAGILLIYAEFNRPGTVVVGCLGALFAMLALFGLGQLPLRGSALAMLAAGIALLVLALWFPLRRATLIAADFCLLLGLARLVVKPEVNFYIAVAAGSIFSEVTHRLLTIALLARRKKRVHGPESISLVRHSG